MLQLRFRLLRSAGVELLFTGMLLFLIGFLPWALQAQTAGEGTITGTVVDSTGAVVGNATVTATNLATGVSTTRTTSSAGLYTISPLPVGTYSVTVSAKGFKTLMQENLHVDALSELAFNPDLNIGAASETVTVTTAPPVLDTESPVVGVVMENEDYSSLPILMATTQQRDPTAFATLVPGAQSGSRTPVIGGIANYQGYLYLDGVPAETINQQGDNRPVALSMSLEAVDQFQVLTSVPPAEYMGAGATNYTMKSGGQHYHGQVSDFVRNTVLDAWQFSQKVLLVKNVQGQSVPAGKNIEHTDEFSASVGGHVPHTGNKLFFFAAYDKYHSRYNQAPSPTTIPTAAMEQGDFSALADANNDPIIFDPATNSCTPAGCTRQPFSFMGKNNVIPPGRISPIAQKMESFLPNYPGSPNASLAPNVNSTVFANNYLSTGIGGRDNHLIDWRVDFDLSPKNRISSVGAMGHVVYANNYGAPYLPPPYQVGDFATIVPKQYNIEDAYTVTDHLTNQFKIGYTRFFMPITNPTQGVAATEIGAMGVTNLPKGQAGQEFPGVTFGGSGAGTAVNGIGKSIVGQTAPATWGTDSNAASTQLTIPNNYSLIDNVQWLKGRHQFTFGITYQFQGLNNANPATFTGILPLGFDQYATANYSSNSSNIDQTNTGYGYASFLIGAVGASGSGGTTGTTLPLQNVATIYSRIKTIAPYAEDTYKLTSKVTVDVGLRWDYLPPLHEKFDHFTFLNPTAANSATGTPGALEFDGNYGGPGVSCGCTTPIQTYWKNWGPRVGFTYELNDKTVIRAGSGVVYSQGGGTGGGRVSGGPGASNGAGQALGFNTNAVAPGDTLSGPNAGPSFYLDGSNSSLFGPGYTYPAAPTPGAASTILSAGNYVNGSGKFVTPSSMGYVDPYFSGRAPEYTFWSVGFERSITKDMTLQVNYVGDEAHHTWDGSSTNERGYWNNQLDPKYLAALGGLTGTNAKGATVSLLTAPATSANVAILDQAMAGVPNPTSFINAANAFPSQSTVTIAQMLTPFSQYSSLQDGWGGSFVENFSYNALQVTLSQRMSRGLSFNVNYTYSKNLGDDGTFRSGYPIPAAAIDGHAQSWRADRIERSWTTISVPHIVNAYSVYQLPFGKGAIGANSRLVRALAGGWQLSDIYTYSTGSPFAVTWSAGGNCANAAPNSGQCMPSVNPNYGNKSPRINGSYGKGPGGVTYANANNIKYIDINAFQTPQDISATPGSSHQYLIGNAPRTRAFNIVGPGNQNINASVRRSFAIHENLAFIFQADCTNLWNKMVFGNPVSGWSTSSTSTFGEVGPPSTSPRDFQLSAHLSF
jgi:hypothetical protein